jgi:hypothetical protein
MGPPEDSDLGASYPTITPHATYPERRPVLVRLT